jgi:hypothetical protein
MLLCGVVPAVTHAESQLEWFQRQLQMTDGHTPDLSAPAPASGNASGLRTDVTRVKPPESGTGYVGTSKEENPGRARLGYPGTYYNGLSPYASDPQYSAP